VSVWCVYPTANSHRCAEVTRLWTDAGYRVAVLRNEDAPICQHTACGATYCEHRAQYPGFPASINYLANCIFAVDGAATCFVCGSDDILPCKTRSATALEGDFLEHFGGTLGVMHLCEHKIGRWQDNLFSAWVGREYHQRVNGGRGYVWPEYYHLYTDTEAYYVATRLGLLWRRHEHGETYAHHSITGRDTLPAHKRRTILAMMHADRELFERRREAGFPGHELSDRRT